MSLVRAEHHIIHLGSREVRPLSVFNILYVTFTSQYLYQLFIGFHYCFFSLYFCLFLPLFIFFIIFFIEQHCYIVLQFGQF